MNDSLRSEDSAPSLSTYPSAFVNLITTFIRRAEQAETRAHKVLVILKAKDKQLLELQGRMETLEKIAFKLEEVIVPPLELPESSSSSIAGDSPHPRDHQGNIPLETIYERTAQDSKHNNQEENHNCYLRCQHLIDGLERSNSQLRKALRSESTQRVKEHEQYLETLAKVTDSVKRWQLTEDGQEINPGLLNMLMSLQPVSDVALESKKITSVEWKQCDDHRNEDLEQAVEQVVDSLNYSEDIKHPKLQSTQEISEKELLKILKAQLLQTETEPSTDHRKADKRYKSQTDPPVDQAPLNKRMEPVYGAAGDTIVNYCQPLDIPKDQTRSNEDNLALLDRKDMQNSLEKAERIVEGLRKRFEQSESKFLKRNTGLVQNSSVYLSSRSSTSSYFTTKSSSMCPMRRSRRKIERRINAALKRRNAKLRSKYNHVCDKFKNCLKLCEKLQLDVVKLTKTSRSNKLAKQVLENSTQTDKYVDFVDKVQSGRSTHILQGRLDAAAKVMAKQSKHIEDLQKQLNESNKNQETLKKRIARAETTAVEKDSFSESCKRDISVLENRNQCLSQEITNLKNTMNKLNKEICVEKEAKSVSDQMREAAQRELEEIKMTMEEKLSSLSKALQEREDMSEKAGVELEAKLSCLRHQFIEHVNEARNRLTLANHKIHQLYTGIEMFLNLLFSCGRSPPPLSPASQAEAVQVASDILQLTSHQLTNILHSARSDHHQVNLPPGATRWIRECNQAVRAELFSDRLASLLVQAVGEAWKLR